MHALCRRYWLGDQLIAVSVVDVLPKCISSVYMFWDKRCGFAVLLLLLLNPPPLRCHCCSCR